MEHKPNRQLSNKLINIQIKIVTILITYKYWVVRSKLCLEIQHLPILMDGRIRITIDLKSQGLLNTSFWIPPFVNWQIWVTFGWRFGLDNIFSVISFTMWLTVLEMQMKMHIQCFAESQMGSIAFNLRSYPGTEGDNPYSVADHQRFS